MNSDLGYDLPWRLAQVFLSRSGLGIFEVYVCDDGKYEGWLSCNCPGYQKRLDCKHIRFVSENVNDAGIYPTRLDRMPTDEEIEEFVKDKEFARTWILEHSLVRLS